MGFKSFFSSKRSSTAPNAVLEQPRSLQHTVTSTASTHSKSKKIARGVRTIFTVHARDKASRHLVADAPSVTSRNTTHQDQSDMNVAAKPAEREHVLVSTPTYSSATSDSAVRSTPSAGTPPTTASSVAPNLKGHGSSTQQSEYTSAMDALRDAEKMVQQRHAMMKMPLQAEASRKPSPFATLIGMAKSTTTTTSPTTQNLVTPDIEANVSHYDNTQGRDQTEYQTAIAQLQNAEKVLEQRHSMMKPPVQAENPRKLSLANVLIGKSQSSTTTPTSAAPQDFVTSDVEANNNNKEHTDTKIEYRIALEGLHNAEKLLEQRHAAIKVQRSAMTPKKTNSLGALIKKTNALLHPQTGGQIEGAIQHAAPNSPLHAVTAQPTRAPLPSYRNRNQPETSNAACNAVHRRRLIKELVYRAIHGCDEALGAFEELNDHFFAKARGEDVDDLGLNFEGVHVFASQLRAVEKTWLSRVNAMLKLQGLVERKYLGPEDFEQIQTQLFPNDKQDLLGDEYFEIFVKGLGSEGIITQSEVKALINLSVSTEEFDLGLLYTGHPKKPRGASYANNPAVLALFDMPKIPHRSDAPLSTNPLFKSSSTAVSRHLRILVEAAAYSRQFWAGYFFTDAGSKLSSFHEAWVITQSGLGTPPKLTDYKRPWTYAETRLLQRGQLLCNLLKSFEKNELTDFGIIRAVRGTYVRLPGQPKYDIHDLSTFLYHRVPCSGLPLTMIPEIMALHLEYDADFANPRLRALVREQLREKNEEFKAEEEERLREITESRSSFESMKKKELGRWGRCKAWARKLVGKKEDEAKPFDPFAE